VNRGFTKRINGVTKDESDLLLNYLINLVTQNHDAQVTEVIGIVQPMTTMQQELVIVCALWVRLHT
jgi:hypothetical protein